MELGWTFFSEMYAPMLMDMDMVMDMIQRKGEHGACRERDSERLSPLMMMPCFRFEVRST